MLKSLKYFNAVVRSWMFWKMSSFNMIVKLLSFCVDLNVSKSITLQYCCKVIIIIFLLLLLFKLIYYHLVWRTFFIDFNVVRSWMFQKISPFNMVVRLLSSYLLLSYVDLNVSKDITFNTDVWLLLLLFSPYFSPFYRQLLGHFNFYFI